MCPLGQNFLKALFLRGPSAGPGCLRGFQAQGCVDKAVFLVLTFFAMDFSRAGAVTGGPPLQAPLAMYPFGGFAQATLSSCPSDEFPLSSLPCGPKALVDVPFLSAGGNFLKKFGWQKMPPEQRFSKRKEAFWSMSPPTDFGSLAAIPFRY